MCSEVSRFPTSPNWVLGRERPAQNILGNLGELRQNVADSMAGCPNLGVPSGSAGCLLSSVVSYFPPFPIRCWERGPAQKNIGGFGGNPPKYAGPKKGGSAKFRRSVKFRGVPWCPAVLLFAFGGVASPLPNWALGKGRPAKKILGNVGGVRRILDDCRAAWINLGAPSRSVVFRGVSFCVR